MNSDHAKHRGCQTNKAVNNLCKAGTLLERRKGDTSPISIRGVNTRHWQALREAGTGSKGVHGKDSKHE
jgi:hypothetical protein